MPNTSPHNGLENSAWLFCQPLYFGIVLRNPWLFTMQSMVLFRLCSFPLAAGSPSSLPSPPSSCDPGSILGEGDTVFLHDTIHVTAGQYGSEVAWTLSCLDGSSLSGGAPFGQCIGIAEGSECRLDMTDSWGDGWNGAVWRGYGQSMELAMGSAGSVTFIVAMSPPMSPPMPPMPPLSPAPDGFKIIADAPELRTLLESARDTGTTLQIFMRNGVYLLDGSEFVVDGFNLTLVSDVLNATLDAGKRTRHFSVTANGNLALQNIRLVNGQAEVREKCLK